MQQTVTTQFELENLSDSEQVYKMNLDDLCAYITKPETKGSKKKGKKKGKDKKAEGNASGVERSPSVDAQVAQTASAPPKDVKAAAATS
jgi:hypothetical protein